MELLFQMKCLLKLAKPKKRSRLEEGAGLSVAAFTLAGSMRLPDGDMRNPRKKVESL